MLVRYLMILCLWMALPAWAESTLLVFGDSLAADYGMAREAGWVHLLQQRLDRENQGIRVINASISGETTAGGRARIEAVLKLHRPAIVILELGANDGLRGLPPEVVQDNLAAMIEACQRHQAQVLLVGMRLPPNYGKTYTERFSAIYSSLSAAYKVALIPFLLEGLASRQMLFQNDQLHPNAAAQPLVLENIWKALKPLLRK